jgi:SulP family sulfate permease
MFGAAEKMAEIEDHLETLTPIVILRLRNMTAIGAAGFLTRAGFARMLRESGRMLILCGARSQPAELMRQAEFEQRVLGQGNLCPNISAALQRAGEPFATNGVAQKTKGVGSLSAQ